MVARSDLDTIPKILHRLANDRPSDTALTWYQAGQRAGRWSTSHLLNAVRITQSQLQNAGLAPRDRVVLQCGNRPEFVVAALAGMAMGAVLVPIAPDESEYRIRRIVKNSQPAMWLSDQDQRLSRDLGVPQHILLDVMKSLHGPWASTVSTIQDMALPPSAPAVLLYTSGTTGRPKGVTLSHRNLTANAEGLRRILDIREGSTHVCVLPLHHANAFGFSMITTLYAGGHLVLNDAFPLFAIGRIINDEQAETISVVPQILRVWLRRPVRSEEVPSLRALVSAAAPLSVELARSFHSTTGLRIYQGYGLSECTNFATTIPDDISASDYLEVMHCRDVPSVGVELYGNTCHTIDPKGDLLPAGRIGEIVVRGDTVMSGYWRDAAATAETLRDGDLHTGDLGYWLTVGGRRFFFITGRRKELIIRAGLNIFPREVEDEMNLPYDHAVVGFDNDVVGEEVGLYVAGPLAPQAQESLALAIQRVPLARRPKVVAFGGGAVPRTATGKVRRSLVAHCFEPYRALIPKAVGPLFTRTELKNEPEEENGLE